MKRAISIVILAIVITLVINNNAYALNYRPIEFITTVDGTTIKPFGLAIDNENRVIVSDTENNKIHILKKGDDGNWSILGSFDRRSAVDLGFKGNGNLMVLTHVHPEGAIYEYNLTYNSDGTLANATIVRSVLGVTPERTLFMFPHGLAITSNNGNEYVLIGGGVGNDRKVMVFDSELNLLFSFDNNNIWNASNSIIGNVNNGFPFATPSSILEVKPDGNGNVIVAYKIGVISIYSIDYDNKSVTRLVTFGAAGTDLGYFNEPRGVIHDTVNNYLIVSDNLNQRLQVFDYNAITDNTQPNIIQPIFYFGSGIAGNGERQLNAPRKIDLDSSNQLYVADMENYRIPILTLDESIRNDQDIPIPEPIEEHEWYKYTGHREMFQVIQRVAYTKGVDARTAIDIPSKALDYVLKYIRTLPDTARLNIPWNSHLKPDLEINDERDSVYSASCVIGAINATGVSNPSTVHAPPLQVGDALYCSLMAIVEHDSNLTLGITNAQARVIDPDGNVKDVYYADSAGMHAVNMINMPVNSTERFFFMPFATNIDNNGLWRLEYAFYEDGNLVSSRSIEFYVGNTYQFNNNFNNVLREALLNAGVSNDNADNAINVLDNSNVTIPDNGVLVVNATEGSVYLFGCILPHMPPLNIGDTITCLIFFSANPSETITINDLHVYANAPSGTIPINSWNWSPTIPNPFLWLSSPITLNQAGQWQIVADFTENGTVVISLDVTFNVLPETVIGAIAVIGSMLGIAAYRYRRYI